MKIKIIAGAFVLFVILGSILMLWDKCKYARLERHRRYYTKQLGCSPDAIFNDTLFEEYFTLVWFYPGGIVYRTYDVEKLMREAKQYPSPSETGPKLFQYHKIGYLSMTKGWQKQYGWDYYYSLTAKGRLRVGVLDEKFKTFYYKAKKIEESMSERDKLYCRFVLPVEFFEYLEKYQRK